jgi:hypothetical protein
MKNKIALPLLLIFSAAFLVSCAGYSPETTRTVTIDKGVGLGAVIAVVVSWSRNRSILWAILHGIFGWFYVIYFAITRDRYNEGEM